MGTLGKAYGSYGAYILASSHIISFLVNRGKPIIYSTAPSVIDTALALINIEYATQNAYRLNKEIQLRQQIIKEYTGLMVNSLIVPILMPNNQMSITYQKRLEEKGYLVGAIRQPTVEKPILRVIPRLGTSLLSLKSMLYEIKL